MVRAARPEDVPAIYRLIRELADYEHSLGEVTGTEEELRRSLFGAHPAVYAHVATGDYMGEHWLASFAVYLLTTRPAD